MVSANRQDDDNPDFPQGQVTKTDPAEGTPVRAGSTVTLFVSTGNVLVPDVVGKTKAEATAAPQRRQAAGQHVEGRVRPDPRHGGHARTSRPTPPSSRTGSSTWQIAIAPTTATIPNDLVGKTYDQVVQQLQALGLTQFKRIDDGSDKPVGEVLWTDPSAGDEVELDQQIDIHVSKGPGNQPSPSNTQKP